MNRYNYYSNAARFLGIGALVLVIAKAVLMCGTYFPNAVPVSDDVSAKISNVSFYGFLVLSFLSFNGESSFLKKNKDYRKRTFTVNLRRLVFLNLFMVFFKNAFITSSTSRPLTTFGGVISRIFVSVLLSISLPSFVLFASSVYYFLRDRKIKKLFPLHILVLVFSVLYFIVKFIGNTYTLGVEFFGEAMYSLCMQSPLSDILCLLQYIADVVLLFAMYRYFDVKADEFDALFENEKKVTATSLYNEKGYGIDDFDELLSETGNYPE